MEQNWEINSYTCSQLIFDKGAEENSGVKEETVFSTNGAETTDVHSKEWSCNPTLKSYTKINSEWIKELSVRAVKLLEEYKIFMSLDLAMVS